MKRRREWSWGCWWWWGRRLRWKHPLLSLALSRSYSLTHTHSLIPFLGFSFVVTSRSCTFCTPYSQSELCTSSCSLLILMPINILSLAPVYCIRWAKWVWAPWLALLKQICLHPSPGVHRVSQMCSMCPGGYFWIGSFVLLQDHFIRRKKKRVKRTKEYIVCTGRCHCCKWIECTLDAGLWAVTSGHWEVNLEHWTFDSLCLWVAGASSFSFVLRFVCQLLFLN